MSEASENLKEKLVKDGKIPKTKTAVSATGLSDKEIINLCKIALKDLGYIK